MEEYRLVMQYKNKKGLFVDRETIAIGEANAPKNITDLGLRHSQQIEILKRIQDSILNGQSQFLKDNISHCPKCSNKLSKNGINLCTFNAVFTDHKVPVYRQICGKCKWSSIPSISSLFGTHMHPDLTKLQCEESSKQSYPKARDSLNRLSLNKRAVNSMMTLHGVVESVANYISKDTDIPTGTKACSDLVVQVDGGHLNSKEESSRSFEALTTIVYQPNQVIFNSNLTRGEISKKHCVASALDDEQFNIKQLTLVAAKKEGLSMETDVVAICDGAQNCWNVIDSLSAHCRSVTCILDWFHIGMKMKNIALPEKLKAKFLRIKWHLWRGNIDMALVRLTQLSEQASSENSIDKINKFHAYIENNQARIVDYRQRQKDGNIFTSNNAECTVESLINQRCKGKKHMQWSREGAHAILQIRAASASKDWDINWEKYILGAYPIAA